jgi:ABC-2 type transport system ATP-binding protein
LCFWLVGFAILLAVKSIIVIHNASVLLGRKFQALNHVSARIEIGKIVGFIGPSGAGKTTLIRTIVGRQRVSGGWLQVLGMPAGSAALRSRISYMTQENSVYADLTVLENLEYFAAMEGFSRKQSPAVCEQALIRVAMVDKAHVLVSSLSGGQKQRVSLAVALLGDPELLVLDEPTVGLDPVLREQLWTLFRELAATGKTIIVSSHVMDEAERCDDLLLIRDGRLVAQGTPEQLRKRTKTPTVERAFLKLAGGAA